MDTVSLGGAGCGTGQCQSWDTMIRARCYFAVHRSLSDDHVLVACVQISDIADLRGKAVVTIEPYIHRLYANHRIVATDKEGLFSALCLIRLSWLHQSGCQGLSIMLPPRGFEISNFCNRTPMTEVQPSEPPRHSNDTTVLTLLA